LLQGKSSGEKAEAHKDSDQVLLILEGELTGEVGDEHVSLKKGDVIIIPNAVKHRFTNRSRKRAVTFNVYSPPAYSAD
jgi:mannose-6-phosphate isomerase-like protein (cupin superfamily)